MIKSNRFSDVVRVEGIKPQASKGYIKLDLTDTVTGKVKERVEGENLVFHHALFSTTGWISRLNQAQLCLTDWTEAPTHALPYTLGNIIGFGMPNEGGSGLKRGAYVPANSGLAIQQPGGLSWKYQYEFGPSQALGNIGNISLNTQHGGGWATNTQYYPPSTYYPTTTNVNRDPNYRYTVSPTHSMYHNYTTYNGLTTTLNVVFTNLHTGESISRTVTSESFAYYTLGIAYDITTDRWAIVGTTRTGTGTTSLPYVYSSYVQYYSGLLDTPMERLTFEGANNFSLSSGCVYIYKGKAFLFGTSQGRVSVVDLIYSGGVTYIEWDPNTMVMVASNVININSCIANGGVIMNKRYYNTYGAQSGQGNPNYRSSFLFDFETQRFIAGFGNQYSNGIYVVHLDITQPYPIPVKPLGATPAQGVSTATGIASKTLDAPIIKTDSNGLVATYELLVEW